MNKNNRKFDSSKDSAKLRNNGTLRKSDSFATTTSENEIQQPRLQHPILNHPSHSFLSTESCNDANWSELSRLKFNSDLFRRSERANSSIDPAERTLLNKLRAWTRVIAGKQIVARSSSNLIRDTITISACPIAPWSRPTDGNYPVSRVVSYRGCNSLLAVPACVETDNRNKYTRVEFQRDSEGNTAGY